MSLTAPQIEAIVKLLEGEGIDPFSACDIAVKIVDFERNVDRQRTIHLKRISGTLVDAMAITKAAYEEDPKRAQLEAFAAGEIYPDLAEADETLREAAKWLVSQERKELAKRIHVAGREAPESLRYYRRASNQLLKALRRLR